MFNSKLLVYIKPFCIGSLMTISLMSCGDPPPVMLSAADRAEADTIYLDRMRDLRPQFDSICESIKTTQ